MDHGRLMLYYDVWWSPVQLEGNRQSKNKLETLPGLRVEARGSHEETREVRQEQMWTGNLHGVCVEDGGAGTTGNFMSCCGNTGA